MKKWSNSNKDFDIYSLLTEGAEQGKPNKGDIAEGILGAAIYARFIKRDDKDVTSDDIDDVFTELENRGSKEERKRNGKSLLPLRTISSSVKNTTGTGEDNITFKLSLAPVNTKPLLDGTSNEMFPRLYESALKFVNTYLKDYSTLIANDGVSSDIDVIADGVGDQKGTKADLTIVKDGREIDFSISLKAGTVKQFGQVFGASFDKQTILWDAGFDIDISELEEDYNEILSEIDPTDVVKFNDATTDAVASVYEDVASNMKTWLKGDKSKKEFDTLMKIAKAIDFHATRNDPDMVLVQLDKSDFKALRFGGLEKISEALKSIDLDVNYQLGRSKGGSKPKPIVVFYDKNKQELATGSPDAKWGEASVSPEAVLMQIRFKTETKGSKRNYFEKGHVMTDLFNNLKDKS